MKLLLVFAVLLNLGALAYGQGLFGPAPVNQGLDVRLPAELSPQLVVLGTPDAKMTTP